MVKTEYLDSIFTNNGDSLLALSSESPVLLVFLRHFGCVFCREALHDLSERKDILIKSGIKLVLVHMSEYQLAESYFEKYGIPGVSHISDSNCNLYKHFGLAKGGAMQLLGLKNMIRGFEVASKSSIYPKMGFIGDGFQMPGIFVLNKGAITDRFVHISAADRPDYDAMIAKVNS